MRLEIVLVGVALCVGCPDPTPVPPPPDELQFYPVLDDVEKYDDLVGAEGTVKYLAQVEGAPVTAPIDDECVFQNTALYSFHLFFLNAQPGGEDLLVDDYTSLVLQRDTRVWWGGDIRFFPEAEHPTTGEPGVLTWGLYTQDSANNRLVVDDVRQGFARLAPCLPAFEGQLAFTPGSAEQIQTTRLSQGALAAEGIAVLLP